LAQTKRRYVGGSVTEDDHYLVITASTSTYGNELFIKDLTSQTVPLLRVDNFNSDNYVMDNEGSKLFIVTDLNAPNKRIVTVDVSNPKAENWKTSFLKLRMYCHHQPVAVLFLLII
jgi:prolyl oligopeptidase